MLLRMTRDMEPANWARTLPRLERNIAELRELGCQVTLPPDFRLPPSRRGRHIGRVEIAVIHRESGPELLLDRGHHPLL